MLWRLRGRANASPLPPRPSVLDPFKTVIDDILRADLDAPRKQRHTAKRIFDRLIDEHSMQAVSYQVVRGYVAERKPKIRAEAGHGPVNVFLPQTHRPGEEAEADFGEIVINLRGEPVTCMLFSLRLSFSGKTVHRIFASGGTEAFLEGHIHAFTTLGGVPTDKIRYDNLKAAVAQVLGFSRQRVETARWTAFRSHYGIEAFYCQPGLQGALPHYSAVIERGSKRRGSRGIQDGPLSATAAARSVVFGDPGSVLVAAQPRPVRGLSPLS
ncbi:hypothetical protein [Jidongwangia harbinensis]|uniref:hypothetical protein n=1 Tax=Jidongwangia harbinensis TaxID=2878561 RepID=UPI001CD93B6F|nr:hypothetical protein [Jidongwangia harbinensis]MCA2216270.1 hypothetical protein [Jidongwangia harbinensis]MCA2217005.1 hypothetical protein [Jidongwangia harbinensis]